MFAGETPLLSKQCLQHVMIATKGCGTPSRPCIETLWRTFCSRKEPLLCHSLGWWPWGRVSVYQVSSVICLRVSRERYTGQVILLRVADTPRVTILQRNTKCVHECTWYVLSSAVYTLLLNPYPAIEKTHQPSPPHPCSCCWLNT